MSDRSIPDSVSEASASEAWVPIPGMEVWYSVSTLGRVRSEKRPHNRGQARGGRVLKPVANKGYLYFTAYTDEGARKVPVHQAIALAFIGPCPEGLVTNHKNCIKADNRPENLEYVTQADNLQHARDNGHGPRPTPLRGEQHHQAKLTEGDVRDIRCLAVQQSVRKLADKYGVSPGCISGIVYRHNWKHVE